MPARRLMSSASVSVCQAACWSWTVVTPTQWFSQTLVQIFFGENFLLLQGKKIISCVKCMSTLKDWVFSKLLSTSDFVEEYH